MMSPDKRDNLFSVLYNRLKLTFKPRTLSKIGLRLKFLQLGHKFY